MAQALDSKVATQAELGCKHHAEASGSHGPPLRGATRGEGENPHRSGA